MRRLTTIQAPNPLQPSCLQVPSNDFHPMAGIEPAQLYMIYLALTLPVGPARWTRPFPFWTQSGPKRPLVLAPTQDRHGPWIIQGSSTPVPLIILVFNITKSKTCPSNANRQPLV
jgi:hypothetical protein